MIKNLIKNLSKNKKNKKGYETPKEPRDLETIKRDMNQLLVSLGNEQYQVEVHKSEVQRISTMVLNLNQEGAKRIELDATAAKLAAAAAAEAKGATTNAKA